jgi:hypothetical protein
MSRREDAVIMTRPEFEALLKSAAKEGAKEALADVGLADDHAGNDMRDLRSMLQSWRIAKKEAVKSVTRRVTDIVFAVLLIGLAAKFGIKLLNP